MSEFENQVVLITGAKGGLGAHITEAFLDAGARVVGSSRGIRDTDFPQERFAGIPADLSDPAAAHKLAGECVQRFGRIDALVHVTGGFAGGKPIHETDDATFVEMIDVNLRAGVYTLQAVIPHMRQAGRGRIVVIAGRAGVEPSANIGAYSASKAALISVVRTAALENRDKGITANSILPGTIDTEKNRRNDPGADYSQWIAPDRLAALALFLVSDAGAQINGAAIPVYGMAL